MSETYYRNDSPHGRVLRPVDSLPDGWSKLSRGQALGKKIVVKYVQTDGVVFAPVSILQIHSDDHNAQQINVTLSPPSIIPVAIANLPIDTQSATNEQSNEQVIQIPGNFPASADPFQWINPSAIIEWGIGGVSERAEVDLLQGLCVNLCASFVRVWAVLGDNGSLGGTDAAYVLSAFVGPGYPKQLGAQRTFWVGDLSNGVESDAFPIPKFAKRVTLIGGNTAESSSPAITAGMIRFWQSINLSGAGRRCVGNIEFTGVMPQPSVIPNGAAYFSIVGGTTPDTLYGAIFDLAI